MNDQVAQITRKKNTIRIYGAGGTGVAITAALDQYAGKQAPGFANILTTFIDTSDSDLPSNIDPAKLYLFPELDGSGQERAENHPEYQARIKEILQKHRPSDLNIIITSASGGTGSGLAPELIAELLQKDHNVIVVAVGDAATRKFARNSRATLKSFMGNVAVTKHSLAVFYAENSRLVSEAKINEKIEQLVTVLSILYSGENRRMDSKDLYKWLRPTTVDGAPMLTALSIVEGSTDYPTNIGQVVSLATLTNDRENAAYPEMVDIQFTGFPDNIDREVSEWPIHFVLSDGVIAPAIDRLTKTIDELEENRQARLAPAKILDSSDVVGSSGIVFD